MRPGDDSVPVTGTADARLVALSVLAAATVLVAVRLVLWPLTAEYPGPFDVQDAATSLAVIVITVGVSLVLARSGMPLVHAWAMLAVAAALTGARLESREFAGTLLPYIGNVCAGVIAAAFNAFFLRWPLPSLSSGLRVWFFAAYGALIALGVADTYAFPAWRANFDPWDQRFLDWDVPPEFHGHVVVPLSTGWLVIAETVTLVVLWRRMHRATGPARTGLAAVVAAFGLNYVLDVVVNAERIPTLWDGPLRPDWPIWFPLLGGLDSLVTVLVVVSPLVDVLLRRVASAVVVDEVVARAADGGLGEPLDESVRRALGDPSARMLSFASVVRPPRCERVVLDVDSHGLGRLVFAPGAGYTADPRHVDAVADAVRLGLQTTRRRSDREDLVVRLADARANAVEAGLAERRRIERNLHDGVQQALLALSAVLARADLARDQRQRDEVLDEARRGAADVRHMLAAVAQGLRPPALAQGLAAALPALRAGGGLDVRLDLPECATLTLPAAVESAAYYLVAESLSNAVKHAEATKVDVRVERDDDDLVVTVVDDGRGGAAVRPDGGLASIEERVLSAGGSFAVTSAPDRGSRIRAVFPSRL
jgi:signal transduction histidine kinase